MNNPPPTQSESSSLVFSETPIILKTYQLFRRLQPLINKFPKPWRYSLGESLERGLIGVIETTTQALHARQPLREPLILKLLGTIQSLQLFIRLAFDENLLNEHQFFSCSAAIAELNRMALGWLKATRAP